MGSFDDRARTPNFNLHDGYGLPIDSTAGGRLKVDVILQEASDAIGLQVNNIAEAIQTILKDLDGYHPDSTGQEHYSQLNQALQLILLDLDGYMVQADLDGLGQTVSEHYNQHSDALQTILSSLDGYGLSGEDLSITVSEHYDQHSVALQTILKDLDGYIPSSEKGVINGVATLDGGGKIPVGQIPAVSLPEVFVVLDDTARLALTVQEGDEAIQTLDGYHWIYDGYDWYVRPVNPHGADHYAGGADQVIAQNLSSNGATDGQIMVADGSGGWIIEDNSSGSGLSGVTHQLAFTKNGTAKDVWLSLYENSVPSNASPAIMPWKSKLIGISFTNRNKNSYIILKTYVSVEGDGNSPITKVFEWYLTNVRVARKTTFIADIIFDAGDKIAVFADGNGGDIHDPVVILYFQTESDAIEEESSENYSGSFSLGGGTT